MRLHQAVGQHDRVGRHAGQRQLAALRARAAGIHDDQRRHDLGLGLANRLLCRVIQEVEAQGKLDNTLIIFISGDNGCSAEGSTVGTPVDMAAIQGVNVPVPDQLKFYDVWGSAETTPHMAVGWTWAFDTPFKWTKQVASHFGGTRQGMAISWPGHIKDVGSIRTQFHHIIDVVPTILDATGIQAPVMVDGVAQKPIEGVSMAYTFDKANTNAPSTRTHAIF